MEKSDFKKIIWMIAILAVIVLISYVFINKIKTANAVKEMKEQKSLEEMFPENCDCLEKERIKCSDGFELIGSICKNETLKIFTNVLKGCSEYKCSDGNYLFNSTTQKWGIKK